MNFWKNRNIFPEKGGGGQRPFENFPKIHPFSCGQPSLIHNTQSNTHVIWYSQFDTAQCSSNVITKKINLEYNLMWYFLMQYHPEYFTIYNAMQLSTNTTLSATQISSKIQWNLMQCLFKIMQHAWQATYISWRQYRAVIAIHSNRDNDRNTIHVSLRNTR